MTDTRTACLIDMKKQHADCNHKLLTEAFSDVLESWTEIVSHNLPILEWAGGQKGKVDFLATVIGNATQGTVHEYAQKSPSNVLKLRICSLISSDIVLPQSYQWLLNSSSDQIGQHDFRWQGCTFSILMRQEVKGQPKIYYISQSWLPWMNS